MTQEEKIRQLQEQLDSISVQLKAFGTELKDLRKEVPGDHDRDSEKSRDFLPPHQKGRFVLENFIGLRLIHFVGIIVLVAGISLGVKYAVDQNIISEFARIILAWLAGILLFFLSIFLKKKYHGFSAILFSGAMASLYFTSFSAYVYYSFISQGTAYGLMIVFTVFTVYVAIQYRRQEIAVLGMVGAYGIPFLLGSDSPNLFAFFSYIFLINCGILFIHFLRNWKLLKYLSFAITWMIFLSWCIGGYTESVYYLALGYGIAYFTLFLIGSLAYHGIRRLPVDNPDLLIICLNSLAFYFAANIVYAYNYIDYFGPVTLFFLVLHAVLTLASSLVLPVYRNLVNVFLLMTLGWSVLYVPTEWNGLIITLVWVVMAVVLFIVGLWQKIKVLRIFSIFLFTLTLVKLLLLDSNNFSAVNKTISYLLIGAVLLIISFLYQHYRHMIFGEEKKDKN
jgi:uncharacterized membrane protein